MRSILKMILIYGLVLVQPLLSQVQSTETRYVRIGSLQSHFRLTAQKGPGTVRRATGDLNGLLSMPGRIMLL